MGAQSARCRLRDGHRAPPERRSKCDRAGPDTASWILSRHPWSSRARHPARCPLHSHRRWGRSRPPTGSGRGSSCLRTPLTSIGRLRSRDWASRGRATWGTRRRPLPRPPSRQAPSDPALIAMPIPRATADRTLLVPEVGTEGQTRTGSWKLCGSTRENGCPGYRRRWRAAMPATTQRWRSGQGQR